MINKAYQDFTNNKFNKENNYNAIMAKVKEHKKTKRIKFSSIIAAMFVLLAIGCSAPAIYAQINWNIEFKDYLYRPTEQAKGSLQKLKDSEYTEIVDMDYLTQDGIGIKVDTLLITDNCFDANITFKFSQDVVVDAKGLDFGYAIYDENNNIYTICDRVLNDKVNYRTPFILKELGVKFKRNDTFPIMLSDGSSIGLKEVKETNRTITESLNLGAKTKFPESKKIFIRIYDLGYRVYDWNEENIKESQVETFDISDKEWIFEIDVPDKFLDRETLELKLQNQIPEFEVESITLTETSLVMNFKSEKYIELHNDLLKLKGDKFFEEKNKLMSITDGDGKIYEEIRGSLGSQGCKLTFDIGKQELLDKGIFLNITFDGQTYTTELVEK